MPTTPQNVYHNPGSGKLTFPGGPSGPQQLNNARKVKRGGKRRSLAYPAPPSSGTTGQPIGLLLLLTKA